ncbi:uncharacterized protein STEHIDRAFT_120003 [Stereum hirsutum FP-91666 SS1]|uniref:uncharacterized protein n=1 Tax=Stereum hirsutum (strain FP-91666) TaxID=721885 RepID=UPI000440F1B0|nr:uncharacterized protein STEHIDRAFT_120003 [Stereum hirsutum FP-91666 SS1]EIM89352.1 hypothetical protein STEHIDRAFT_120003 [Stereum hirsutum FP-91666 SS1]
MVQIQSKSQPLLPDKSMSSTSQTTPHAPPTSDLSNAPPSSQYELNSPIWTRLPVELVFATLLDLALSLPVTEPLPPIPTRSSPPSPSLDGPSSPTNDEMLPKATTEHHERHEHEQPDPHHIPITSRKDLLLLSSSVRRLVSPTIYTSLILRAHAQVLGFGALFLPKRPVFGQLDPVIISVPWIRNHALPGPSSLNPNFDTKQTQKPIQKPKPLSLALPLPPSLPSLESTLESLASHGTFSALQNLALTPAVHAAHGYWMRRWVRPRAVMIFQVAGGCGAGAGGGAFGALTSAGGGGGGAGDGGGVGGRRTYGGRTEINWRDRTFSNVEDLYTCTLRAFGTSSIADLIIPSIPSSSSNPITVVLPNSVSGHGEGKLKRIALWCEERRLNYTLDQIESTFFESKEEDPFNPFNPPRDSDRPPAIQFLDMIVLHVRPHSPDVDKAGLERGEGIGWMGVFEERVKDVSGRRNVDFLREEKFFVVPDMAPVRYKTGRMEWKSVVDGGFGLGPHQRSSTSNSDTCDGTGGGGGEGEPLGTGDVWARAKEWRMLAGEGYEAIVPPQGRERGGVSPFRYDFGFSFVVGPGGALLPSATSTSTSTIPPPPPTATASSSIPTAATTATPSTPTQSRLLKMLHIWNATEEQYRTASMEGWFRGGEWDVELGAEGMEGGGAGGWAAMSGGMGGGVGWRTDTPWPGP